MRTALLLSAVLITFGVIMVLGDYLGEPMAGLVFGIVAACALLKLAEKVGWA
jgi:hypothetical protein